MSCRPDGTVLEILFDEPGFAKFVSVGQHFTDFIDGGSRLKAQKFLDEIEKSLCAFDWELIAALGANSRMMHFTGGLYGDGMLIVGAESSEDISTLLDELMRLNNAQANALRESVKKATAVSSANQAGLYDKLMQLNNEFTDLQREMARKNAQLQRLNSEKDQLLGTAAHDLRNPLGAIKMYSELMLGGASGDLNDKQEKMLQKIRGTAEFMLRVVEDTLDLSEIESGKVNLRKADTNFTELVASTVETSQMLAQGKDIKIELALGEGIPSLLLDPHKMEQVLNNLLSNAVKFSEKGTVVKVGLHLKGPWVVTTVKDQGQGIPEHEQAKLFRPFSKTSVRSTAGERSTGLGLAIVKRLVQAHGGKIDLFSRPGEGSTFTVSLPLPVDPQRGSSST